MGHPQAEESHVGFKLRTKKHSWHSFLLEQLADILCTGNHNASSELRARTLRDTALGITGNHPRAELDNEVSALQSIYACLWSAAQPKVKHHPQRTGTRTHLYLPRPKFGPLGLGIWKLRSPAVLFVHAMKRSFS